MNVLHHKLTPEWERIHDYGVKRQVFDDSKPPTRYMAPKPCTHEKLTVASTSTPAWCQTTSGFWRYYTSGASLLSYLPAYGNGAGGVYADLATSVAKGFAKSIADRNMSDKLVYEHWKRCRPTMSGRADLSVFLYELRDVTRMWNVIPRRHVKGASNWQKIRDDIAYANGQHLNFNFGVKPFFSDVKNVFKGMATFEKRLFRYTYNENQRQRRREQESLEESFDSGWYSMQPGSVWQVRHHGHASWDYTSTFWYKYVLPYGEGELFWRAWADTLGLRINPATVWTVLPYSFVIDWFVDVGSMLQDNMSSDWAEPTLTSRLATWSNKALVTGAIDTRCSYDNMQLGGLTYNYRYYKRSVGWPQIQPPDLQTLDADKIRLGSSLLIAKLLG